MSSDLAKQFHSITIGDKNTWDDWHLIPTERPSVAPPGIKTEYIDIPGADGSLDYSEALSGIKKTNREGSWQFIVANDNISIIGVKSVGQQKWYDVYSAILSYIQGKKFHVILDDDPEYFYIGRLYLEEWSSGDQMYSTITINYNFEPYKYPIDTTATKEWLWDDLFGDVIYYGPFDVDETKWRNLVNNATFDATAQVNVTSDMTLKIADYHEATLPDNLEALFDPTLGEIEEHSLTSDTPFELILKPGNNFMKFIGNGRVTIDYSTGRRL